MTPTQTVTAVYVVTGAVVGAAIGYAHFTNKKLERDMTLLNARIKHNNTAMSNWKIGQPLNLV
jgi:hypothetical protein